MGKRKNEAPNRVKLSSEETEALIQRITEKNLTDKDSAVLLDILAFYVWMQQSLSRAKLTIKRLKKLFGFTSEAGNNKRETTTDDSEGPDSSSEKNYATDPGDSKGELEPPAKSTLPMNPPNKPTWDPNKNHGRHGASDYSGCSEVDIPFNDPFLKQGLCPNCAKDHIRSKIIPKPPSKVVLLDSGPLVSGIQYNLQKARCTICEAYFTANLPETVQHRSKYSIKCKTAIAIQHYYGGQPFNRIEMLQAAQGVPLADSTQFDLMNELYQSTVEPVFNELKKHAAQGDSIYYDSSSGRVLEQIIENKRQPSKSKKKSVHATALLSEYNGNKISLFFTDTATAGKQLAEVLAERESEESFKTMSDASSQNFPVLEENLITKWIICLCLAHGRRRFFELLGDCEQQSRFVLDLIARVYENESHCKRNKLNDEERLLHHQKYSTPLMDALYVWFNNLLLYKKVEPNSDFGEAIQYMLKRWQWLTQFLRVAGAALDNNICEQAIKVIIRYRKNSLFYRTFYGATIGDAMMSIMHTAIRNGVNIFKYLNALQEYATEVNTAPEKWLPWCYQATIDQLTQPVPEAINSS